MSTLFSGRLGLASQRISHADRVGHVWLSHGNLRVEDGTLHFFSAGSEDMQSGDYAIPYQGVSMILLGPGTTVSHDVLRILARHNTLLAAVGKDGVKFYTAPPMGQGRSDVARAHARLWSDQNSRARVGRFMYYLRFGEVLPQADISVLRGIEGSRLKETYRILAAEHGVTWRGRRYDRNNPAAADIPNQAINHAATFVESAADVAIASVGALPPLGFIHESSSNAFTLDIADIWRAKVTLPIAFGVARQIQTGRAESMERAVRAEAGRVFRRERIIPAMIDKVKEILRADDRRGDP